MNRIILINLVLIIVFFACDKKHVLEVNGKLDNTIINTPCGNIELELSTMGGQLFFISQDYKLTKTVTLYSDSINISFKNKDIAFKIFDTKKEITDKAIKLNGEMFLKLEFEIKEGVTNGDQIFIYGKNALECESNRINLDTLKILINSEYK